MRRVATAGLFALSLGLSGAAAGFEVSGVQPEQCEGNINVPISSKKLSLQDLSSQLAALISMGCNDPQGYDINLKSNDGDGLLESEEGLTIPFKGQINVAFGGGHPGADCDDGHDQVALTGTFVSFCSDTDVTSGSGSQVPFVYQFDVQLQETAPAAGTYTEAIDIELVSKD